MAKYKISIILTCMTCMSLFQACEDSISRKSYTVYEGEPSILLRSGCEECPDMDECCCYVELNGDNNATLQFCGTSDGGGTCTGTTVCGLISPSGGGQSITLNSFSNPRQHFCMLEGYPFWIYNASTTDDADITISCQGDITNPQEINIHLEPGERFYYETDGSCLISGC